MKQKKCKDALITAYRIDNQKLRANVGKYVDDVIKKAIFITRLIEVGGNLLNQGGMDNDEVTRAENEWRKLVDEWRKR
jgi:hypothetical protein